MVTTALAGTANASGQASSANGQASAAEAGVTGGNVADANIVDERVAENLMGLFLSGDGSLARKPTATIEEVEAALFKRSKDFRDLTVDVSLLSMDEASGALRIGGGGAGGGATAEAALQPHALGQLAGRLGIPANYLLRCEPELRANNVNRWLRDQQGEVMLRMDGEEVRAVLSTRYRPVDNLDLVRMVSKQVSKETQIRFEMTATHFEMQVVSRHGENGNDPLFGGVHIGNSEVGVACISISGLIFRVICLNGLIMGSGNHKISRRHIGNSASLNDIGGQVNRLIHAGHSAVERFKGTRAVHITDPAKVFERIVEHHDLSKDQHAAISYAYTVEPGLTLYHAINAVTRAGNSATLALEPRRQLQEVGGRMLEMAEKGDRWLG